MGLPPDRSALVRVRADLCIRRRNGTSSQLPRRQDPTAREHGKRDRRWACGTRHCKNRTAPQTGGTEEEGQRRERAARIKHIEDRRTAGLSAILTELDELDRLRRLIVMLATDIPVEPMPRLSTFLAWAKEHLAKREARFAAQAIEHRFAAEQLFGDTDDHTFAPSRW